MSGKAVELTVAGQKCRVVTTANERELQALAAMVEEKLRGVLSPGRPVDTRAMLLAAVALAHDAREQRNRADAIAKKAKATLRALLERVDEALEQSDARSSDLGISRRGAGDSARPDGAKVSQDELPRQNRTTTTRATRPAPKRDHLGKEDGAT